MCVCVFKLSYLCGHFTGNNFQVHVLMFSSVLSVLHQILFISFFINDSHGIRQVIIES